MKATSAIYILLLTLSSAWASAVHSPPCYCSNETSIDIYEFKSCPLPSIFASQQPSTTYPISLPLLTFDELFQQLSNNIEAGVHPFENLWEYISFVNGSSVNYLIEEFDDVVSYFDASGISDSLPTVSEMKKSATPIFDAVKEKVSPVISSVKDTVVPIVSKVEEKISPIIAESYKYGLEYAKNASKHITPIISTVEDKVESVISNVKENITPNISGKKGACESFSFSKFTPSLEVMTKNDDMDQEEMADEEDYILVVEFFNDKEVKDESSATAANVTTPTSEEIKRANYNRMLQSIFKFLSILSFVLVGILTMLYGFVLSIVIYVFVQDYFAERFDADANEHFRQLLNQIRNEHRRPKPLALPLPPPPPVKKDQEQQTDTDESVTDFFQLFEDVVTDTDESVGDFFHLVEQFNAEENDEGCSSEADVSMNDTTSHSCA